MVTGLARACLDRGHSVEVIFPYYQCLPDASVEDLQHVSDFDVAKVGLCGFANRVYGFIGFKQFSKMLWSCAADAAAVSARSTQIMGTGSRSQCDLCVAQSSMSNADQWCRGPFLMGRCARAPCGRARSVAGSRADLCVAQKQY